MKILSRINFFFLAIIILGCRDLWGSTGTSADDSLATSTEIMVIVTIILILFILWLAIVYSEKNDNEGKLFLIPLSKMIKYLTRTTPVEKEHEILMSHDYDGIKELDNRIPPWFSILFYGTILFGIIYMIDYHLIGSGDVQKEEYQAEVQQARIQREYLIRTGAFLNEETVTALTDDAALESGKSIFLKNCAACHGQAGEGLVGPNLTDDYWIQGGGIKNIFKTIKYGVPQKGMQSWLTQVGPKEMQEVASYILGLRGTNPANAKEPQGELYTPPAE